jgi:predicted DNA-binding protein
MKRLNEKRITIAFRIPLWLNNKINEITEATGYSTSSIVRLSVQKLIHEYIEASQEYSPKIIQMKLKEMEDDMSLCMMKERHIYEEQEAKKAKLKNVMSRLG